MLVNVGAGWRLIHSFEICVLLVIITDDIEENVCTRNTKKTSVIKIVSGHDKQQKAICTLKKLM